MNQYPKTAVVQAQYSGQQRGNPFLEAMPSVMSYKMLMDEIASSPLIPVQLPEMSLEERRMSIPRLNSLFIPMDYMYTIYDTLYRSMLSSYSNLSLVETIRQQNAIFMDQQSERFSTQAESCSILGVPGIGKTSTIRRCLHLIPQVIEHTQYRNEPFYCKQVLYLMVECPSDCSVKTLAYSIFAALDKALGSNYLERTMHAKSMSVSAATTQIKILCMTHHVGMILVDEIQNAVTTARRQGQVKPLIKFLVELTNDTSTGVCFVGTDLAEEIFTEQEHLRRRTRGLRLTPMKPDAGYRKFITSVWQYQFTRAHAPLTDKLANKIYDLSGGIPAYVTAIFRESQVHALMCGKKCITDQCIQYAADVLGLHVPKTYAKGTSISEIQLQCDESLHDNEESRLKESATHESPTLPDNQGSITDAQAGNPDTLQCKRLYANKRGRKAVQRDTDDLLVAFSKGVDLVEFIIPNGLAESRDTEC